MKVGEYEKLDQALYVWFRQEREKNTPITGSIIAEKAKVLWILCTLPVTSCSSEHSFSGLKRIKTALRSNIAITQPHTAFSAFSRGLFSRWMYLCRVLSFQEKDLFPIKDAIKHKLIPAITDMDAPSPLDRRWSPSNSWRIRPLWSIQVFCASIYFLLSYLFSTYWQPD